MLIKILTELSWELPWFFTYKHIVQLSAIKTDSTAVQVKWRAEFIPAAPSVLIVFQSFSSLPQSLLHIFLALSSNKS